MADDVELVAGESRIERNINSQSKNSDDLASALRNHTGDLLEIISGIEEVIENLVEIFDAKLQAFSHEDTTLSFSSMSVFSESSLVTAEADKTPIIQVNGENDNFISCFRMHQNVAHYLLAITLGGSSANAAEFGQDELRPSEIRLLQLFVDHLMSGFFECVDIDASFGIPGKPIVTDKDSFYAFAQNIELISFLFDFSLGDSAHTFELVVPLAVFDNEDSDANGKEQIETAKQEELIWSEQLYKCVEVVNIPLSLEIANCEMSLANIASLNVGENFNINLNLEHVKILDEAGVQTFLGSLNIINNEIKLRVTGALFDKGV